MYIAGVTNKNRTNIKKSTKLHLFEDSLTFFLTFFFRPSKTLDLVESFRMSAFSPEIDPLSVELWRFKVLYFCETV